MTILPPAAAKPDSEPGAVAEAERLLMPDAANRISVPVIVAACS